MSNKIYSAKVSGNITEKVSSSGGIDGIFFNGTKKKITFIEYTEEYDGFNDFLVIHFEDDSAVYVPADTDITRFIPQ